MQLSKRSFLKNSIITTAGISLFHESLFANMLLDESPFKMSSIRKNVGFFTERGGTIGWMISKNGIVVVDTQFPEQSVHLIGEIKKQSERIIDLLINTHHHGDHSGGNISFKGLTNTLLAHENSKKNQMRVAKERKNEEGQLYPDTTFTKTWSNKIDGETITLRYFGPAHTDGDSITHFENANIVHMGDLVFNRRYPYIDKSAGASIENWIVVLEKTMEIFDKGTKFIFGHAGDGYDIVGTLDDIKAKRNYLNALLDHISAEIKAGKSKEEIMNIQSIKGATEWQGKGIERNLSAAYLELTTQ